MMNLKNDKIQINKIDIINEIATLDPLSDRPFKILVSDDEQYKFLAESFSGEIIGDEQIIQMNGEIVLTIGGRLVRTDATRGATAAVFNIESQIIAKDFPLKRHVFYTAVIYASGIQKSDPWDKLKPVISIVIYKSKDDAPLIEKGAFAGELFKTDDDRKQLTLIAVNTAKWRDAPTEKLRAYLATLHHGIMTEHNKADFLDIDVDSASFVKVQRSIKIACAFTKKQEYEKKGDDVMSAVYSSFLSTEERDAATREGEARGEARGEVRGKTLGFNLAMEVISLLKLNTPIAEIANKLGLSTSDIEKFQAAL